MDIYVKVLLIVVAIVLIALVIYWTVQMDKNKAFPAVEESNNGDNKSDTYL